MKKPTETYLLTRVVETINLWVDEEMQDNPDSNITRGQRFSEHSQDFLAQLELTLTEEVKKWA